MNLLKHAGLRKKDYEEEEETLYGELSIHVAAQSDAQSSSKN